MLAYTTRTGLAAGPRLDALAVLYETVYAEPPYNEGPEQVARFRAGLPDEMARPGFALVTAEDDGALVGAAYGWTMPAGTWWKRADHEPPADLFNVDKLAVMEWIVHPHRREEGIGAELMRRLLQGRRERYATLASNPRSHARQVYARNGWRQVGTSRMPWEGGPVMDLLVLELGGEPVQDR